MIRWIGHDAVIYFGNSGGPLVNLQGEIIGINEIGLGSLGGAIPADVAKSVANKLRTEGRVTRSWIGITPQPLLRSSDQKNGVLISNVVTGSPAEQAGMKAGDVILRFAGVEVTATAPEHIPLYNRVVFGTPSATEVEVVYLRGGNNKPPN